MDEDQFEIEFSYKGQDYQGIVSPGGRKDLTYVVQYSQIQNPQFEKTVEICAEQVGGKWQEQPDEVGEIATEADLIREIGEAIETRDMQ